MNQQRDAVEDMQGPEVNASALTAGLAQSGDFRWVGVDVTDVTRQAQVRLDLGPLASIAFGRCAAAAAMLLWLTSKTPRRLTLDVRGSGSLGQVLVEVSADGGIRGTVQHPHVTGPGGASDLSLADAVGIGLLRVRKEEGVRGGDDERQGGQPGSRVSYESQVELISSEIGADVAYYLQQSEQRRCAIAVGVDVGPTGIRSATGFLIEAMPSATAQSVHSLEECFPQVDPISSVLVELGPLGVAQSLFADASEVGSHALNYRCRCSAERLTAQLGAMPTTEIAALSDNGVVKAECAFCGAVYQLSEGDLLAAGRGSN